jgi:hypothetical protein
LPGAAFDATFRDMAKTIDPKRVLEALEAGGGAELGFSNEEVERARGLRGASDAGAVESLPEPLALAVLEASVKRRAPALAEGLANSSKKELAKAAKKALYRLRSSGVAVAEPAKVEPAREPSKPEAEEDEFKSVVSAVTGTGDRALIAIRPLKGHGLETAQAVINDEHGVTHLVRNEVSRSTWRRQLKELRTGSAPASVEIPLREAARMLAHAAWLNLQSRTAYPAGTEETLRHLGVTAGPHLPEVPAPESGDPRLIVEGHRLHEQPEIAAWLPPEAELRVLQQKLLEVVQSPIQLTEAQQQNQLVEAFRSAAQTFFTPPMKRLYGLRLWAMAEFFELSGRAEAAMLAKAEARWLVHDAPGVFSRFAEGLFEKVLRYSAAMMQAAPGHAGPPEPGPEQPPAPTAEKRTPGGIILP